MPPLPTGIDRNLGALRQSRFSRYLRCSFLASAGYNEADLEPPSMVVVIAPSHGLVLC